MDVAWEILLRESNSFIRGAAREGEAAIVPPYWTRCSIPRVGQVVDVRLSSLALLCFRVLLYSSSPPGGHLMLVLLEIFIAVVARIVHETACPPLVDVLWMGIHGSIRWSGENKAGTSKKTERTQAAAGGQSRPISDRGD